MEASNTAVLNQRYAYARGMFVVPKSVQEKSQRELK